MEHTEQQSTAEIGKLVQSERKRQGIFARIRQLEHAATDSAAL